MEPETPRVLVEGGPVERRVNHVLAALIGFTVGVTIAFGWVVKYVHDKGVQDCRQTELVKTDMRLIIDEAARLSGSSPARSGREREIAVMFYRDALGRLKARRC